MVQVIFIVQGGPQGHGELLNNARRMANKTSQETDTSNARECSKKSVQQGRSTFDARSVLLVREHGKRARTPLAAFFNIPLLNMSLILPVPAVEASDQR